MKNSKIKNFYRLRKPRNQVIISANNFLSYTRCLERRRYFISLITWEPNIGQHGLKMISRPETFVYGDDKVMCSKVLSPKVLSPLSPKVLSPQHKAYRYGLFSKFWIILQSCTTWIYACKTQHPAIILKIYVINV